MRESEDAPTELAPATSSPTPGLAATYDAYAQDPYYLNAWGPKLGTSTTGRRFNWPAAIFGMTWCFYRKMYGVGLLLVVAFFALTFVLGLLMGFALAVFVPSLDGGTHELSILLSVATLLIVRVSFGFLANSIYFRKASRAIQDAAADGVTAEELPNHLAQAGGTSDIGLILGLASGLALNLLARLL